MINRHVIFFSVFLSVGFGLFLLAHETSETQVSVPHRLQGEWQLIPDRFEDYSDIVFYPRVSFSTSSVTVERWEPRESLEMRRLNVVEVELVRPAIKLFSSPNRERIVVTCYREAGDNIQFIADFQDSHQVIYLLESSHPRPKGDSALNQFVGKYMQPLDSQDYQ